MQDLISFWYLESPAWVTSYYKQTIINFDEKIAVLDTAKNISKPLYQDYTWQGRLIGFFLRLFRILFGVLLYALTGILFLISYLIWLSFPVLCLTSIIGSFLA